MFVLHAIDRTRRNHCYARYEMLRDPIEGREGRGYNTNCSIMLFSALAWLLLERS